MIKVRQTKKGLRYDVRLRRPDGTTYNKTFTTRKDAERYERSELSARDQGVWIDPRNASRTLADVAAEWLQSNPAKRASALARDEVALRRHVVPALGDKAVGSITRPDVQRAVNRWSSTMAPRSTRRTYGVLRAVLAMAVKNDLIARTPCRDINLPAAKPTARALPSPDDVARLAEAVGTDHGLMVWLGAMLGLRWGEVAGLRVGRLDLMRGTLTVSEQITRGQGGRRVLGEPKSDAGRRTMSLPPSLRGLLSAHLAHRGLTAADESEFVFVSTQGQPLDYSVWRRRVWQPACRAVGLDGLGFHDLRRLNATVLVAEGVNIKTAQTRLGHSDPRLTLAVYAQATDDADRAAADAIGTHFNLPRPSLRGVD